MQDFFEKTFESFQDFTVSFQNWKDQYYQPLNKRSSEKLKEPVSKDDIEKFVYKTLRIKCCHGEKPRNNTKDNSRPDQNTGCIQCPFVATLYFDSNQRVLKFGKTRNLTHNHKIGQEVYQNETMNRNAKIQNNQEAIELIKTLADVKTSTVQTKQLIQKKYQVQVTTRDLSNIKQKFERTSNPIRDQGVMVQQVLDKIIADHPNNTVEVFTKRNVMTDDNDLQCIYIQTDRMKNWYHQYPEILHIDSTFSINLEKFQLISILAQDNNLRGVPVAYCLMNTDTKENLNFFYENFLKHNNVTKTNAIIIDKDLTNIDLLSQFFNNVQLLLCTFHVLKYVKLKIQKLQVDHSCREVLMELFNKVLYSRDEASMTQSIQKLLDQSPDDFTKYLQDNWFNRKDMWVTFYRKTLINFDTDTNNHIESFHNLLKLRIDSFDHLDVCIQKLYDITFEKLERENFESNTIKQRKLDQNDCLLVKRFANDLSDKAIKMLREQHVLMVKTSYSFKQDTKTSYICVNNSSNKHCIVSINHASQVLCDCSFSIQNQLPCRHIIYYFENIFEHDITDKKDLNELWFIFQKDGSKLLKAARF
jgi:hypothetical protein